MFNFFRIWVQNTTNCLNNHTEPVLGNPFGISLMDIVTWISHCRFGKYLWFKGQHPSLSHFWCLLLGARQVLSLDLGYRADSGSASCSTPEIISEYWKGGGKNVLRSVFPCLTAVSKHASVSKNFSNSFCMKCVNPRVHKCPSKVN